MAQPVALVLSPACKPTETVEAAALLETQGAACLDLAEQVERALRDSAGAGDRAGCPGDASRPQRTGGEPPELTRTGNSLDVAPPQQSHATPAKQHQRSDPTAAARQRFSKPGVLVVDDELPVRILVQLRLEQHGFEVWTASNGREALDKYQQDRGRIAVVLLDVRMPGLDGPATLDALREMDPNVVACFMSGDMGGYEPDELIRRGAVCLISKPFCLDELADVVCMLAGGRVG